MDDTTYMQNLKKMIQMKLFQNKTNLENIFTGVGERDWDGHLHTAVFKIDNQ